MNKKINELAFIRNQLISGKFTESDAQLLTKVKNNIIKLNTPFSEFSIDVINNSEKQIISGNLRMAALEIQLIHNIPFQDPNLWNSDYFYKVELLSYLENVDDVDRIKKIIYLLARLQADL